MPCNGFSIVIWEFCIPLHIVTKYPVTSMVSKVSDPVLALSYRFVGPHSEEIGHHCGEARSKARLGDEAKFELGQTYDVVSSLPVPRRNVQQVRLKKHNDNICIKPRIEWFCRNLHEFPKSILTFTSSQRVFCLKIDL